MVELWQTEWCPASHRVRQRLTELGIDYVTRQVPVERSARDRLRERASTETIPTLITETGTALVGEDAIDTFLDERVPEPSEAHTHRLKAEMARRRYLEEECTCLQPVTH